MKYVVKLGGAGQASSTQFDDVLHSKPSATHFIRDLPRRFSFETFRFRPAEHDIQILHGLARRALQQVIQATDNDRAAAVGCELESDVGIVGANRVLNLRQ